MPYDILPRLPKQLRDYRLLQETVNFKLTSRETFF
jgi:hypothetical protein